MRRPIKKLIDLICSHCKKYFQKYPSQIKNNKDTFFCGNQCVIDYRKIHWKGKIDSICKTCGKEFKFNRAELKKAKGAGSFCSRSCQANGHLFVECLICKKEFRIYQSNIERDGGKYCSKSCFNNRTNLTEYFFKSISKKNHPLECWIWEAAKDKDGYGTLWNGKKIKAHRFSYELYLEKIPNDLFACHHCDTPSCVNPMHLFVGTAKDNTQDAIKKGRLKRNKAL